MFNGIHTAICDLDGLVQRHKRGLCVNKSQKTPIKNILHQKNLRFGHFLLWIWIEIFSSGLTCSDASSTRSSTALA